MIGAYVIQPYMARRTGVVGLLGPTLDNGRGPDRWRRWHPTIGVCLQPTFPVDRFELLWSRHHTALAQTITADIATVSPKSEARSHDFVPCNPWSFSEVYGALSD